MSLKYLKNIWVALFLVLGLASFQLARAEDQEAPKIPPYSSHLVDTASWLSSQEVVDINKRLEGIQSEGKVQIAVLIVDSVKSKSIEEYSMQVAEAWKIGKKGMDNGVLVILARQDKKLRIEVGYGLEGVLQDAITKRIISEKMAHFLSSKENKPYEALVVGIEEIQKCVKGEATTNEVSKNSQKAEGLTGVPWIDHLPTVAKAIAIILGLIAGVILFADHGWAWGTGLLGAPALGFVLALFYGLSVAFTVALGVVVFALVLRIGLPISGALLTGGGSFGGAGSSGSWD